MMAREVVSTRSVALMTALVGLGAVATVTVASATPSSGSASTVIGRAVVSEDIKINTSEIKVMTKDPVEVITQTVTFQPGGTSGWHSHPGPVFVVVKTGTITVYDATCTPRRYSAGQGFVEGPEPAVVRNEGTIVSENVATLLVPQGTPARTDAPSPCREIM